MSERSLIRDADRRIVIAKRAGAVELDLSGLALRNLPYELNQLTELQSLDLSHNRLTTLLNSLGRLTQLQSLNLSHNQLTTLPVFLGHLPHLDSLDLANNPLTEPPPEILDQGTEAVLAYLRSTGEPQA